LAAVVLAVLVPRLHPTGRVVIPHLEETDGSKGSPALALHLKRGEQVLLWDGQSPVRPGDHLRLEVKAEGYGFVEVASGGGARAPLLYAGALDPRHSTLLPNSWTVDTSPGPEELQIVMSKTSLTPAELEAALTSGRRDAGIWTSRLVLPKDLGGGAAP
jgi:hypothetical protein